MNELVALISAVSNSGMKHFSYQTDLESIVISNRETSDCGIETAGPREESEAIERPYAPTQMAALPGGTAELSEGALFSVTAPNVGTVLLNDVRTGEPVVAVGDIVEKGQLLFIIESMKLFIDVAAPASGKIAQVCVESQQAVEYGSVIMKIKTEY